MGDQCIVNTEVVQFQMMADDRHKGEWTPGNNFTGGSMSRQQKAKLRVCASCEWIFTDDQQYPEHGGCPKCAFAHYGARYVYGNKAYRYAKTQQPWFDRKMGDYAVKLHKEIEAAQPTKPPRRIALDLG